MKTTKYIVPIAIAALVLGATQCTTQKGAAIECAPVVGWGYTDTVQTLVALDLHGFEIILDKHYKKSGKMAKKLPEYAIGDTVVFRYDLEKDRDTIYADNLVRKYKNIRKTKAK